MADNDSSGSGSGAGRIGRKVPRHYYTPCPVLDIEGVSRKRRDERHDLIGGNADALIAAKVLTAEMLPAPGKCGIAWRPTNEKPRAGESWFHVPGYLEVRRQPDGSFRVLLAVSREEAACRSAQSEREEKASNQEWEREQAERERERAESAKQLLAIHSPATAEEFRNEALRDVQYVRRMLSKLFQVSDVCAFRYDLDEEDAEEFEDALQSLEDVLSKASIVVDRAKAAQFDVLRKHSNAQKDKPLQQFLTTVARKVRRGSAGIGKQ